MIARALVAAAAGVFLLALGAAGHAFVPLVLRVVAGGLFLLALVRPSVALAATLALAPMATPFGVMTAASLSSIAVLQLLVLPTLAGSALAVALRRAPVPATGLFWPAVAMAAVVIATAVVQLIGLQYATALPGAFVQDLWRHVINDHFVLPREFPPLAEALLWLEALALAVLVEQGMRAGGNARRVILTSAAAGMTVAAAGAGQRIIEVALRSPDPWAAAWMVVRTVRFSPHFPDLNAAGSLFALWFVPFAWWGWRRVSLAAALAAPVVALAVWTTGSRTALAAAVIGLAVAWMATYRPRVRYVVLALAIVVPAAWFVTLNPGRSQAAPEYALGVRGHLARLAFELASERPVFGLGFDGFRRESRTHASPELRQLFPAFEVGENAHNNYLQILVDLGAVGLLAFLWMLATALGPWRTAMREGPVAALPAGLLGGVVAFLITALAGHPLLTPQVLVPALAALGMLAGLGRPASPAPGRAAAVALIVCLAVSLPWRVASQRAGVAGGVAIGGVAAPEAGEGWRRIDARARWFVDAGARAILLEVRVADGSADCAIALAVDGAPTGPAQPVTGEAVRMQIPFGTPASGPRTRRLDLEVVGGPDCAVLAGPVEVRGLR